MRLIFFVLQVTVQDIREKRFQGAIDIANMFEFLSRSDLKTSPIGRYSNHTARYIPLQSRVPINSIISNRSIEINY
jgi:hypothetical protein